MVNEIKASVVLMTVDPLILRMLEILRSNYRPNLVHAGLREKEMTVDTRAVSSPLARTFGIVAHPKWEDLSVMDRAELVGHGVSPKMYNCFQTWLTGIGDPRATPRKLTFRSELLSAYVTREIEA